MCHKKRGTMASLRRPKKSRCIITTSRSLLAWSVSSRGSVFSLFSTTWHFMLPLFFGHSSRQTLPSCRGLPSNSIYFLLIFPNLSPVIRANSFFPNLWFWPPMRYHSSSGFWSFTLTSCPSTLTIIWPGNWWCFSPITTNCLNGPFIIHPFSLCCFIGPSTISDQMPRKL